MSDTITVTGFVATVPRHLVTGEGLPITSFRLASTQRRYDRRSGEWVDGETNWYTVTGFRQLAVHAAASVSKGDRVLVTGRLRIRDWSSGDRSGTTVEVEAEGLGHDLAWGTTVFTRAAASAVLRGVGDAVTGEVVDGARDGRRAAAADGDGAAAPIRQDAAPVAGPDESVA
jgi:single-strand DNA-binding protein